VSAKEHILKALEKSRHDLGMTASDLVNSLGLDRTSVSRYLNQLHREGLLIKSTGKPVHYNLKQRNDNQSDASLRPTSEPGAGITSAEGVFDKLVGSKMSLSTAVQQAKAAILYPPRGLHTLILGETGVGKSLFAEMMFHFAQQAQMVVKDAPFVRFNCADYADNPQLLMSQIFGVKKGAFTGSNEDRVGLLKRADTGMLFLDEVHRLTPQGQEMLFTFMDKGFFRRMGDTESLVHSDVQLIAATTEDPSSVLLKTFMRRIPMTITLPSLRERELEERYKLVATFLKDEAIRLQKSIYINRNSLISLLLYDCPNNIGQLKSDLQLACAKAFLRFKTMEEMYILIQQGDLPTGVKKGLMRLKEVRDDLDRLLNPMDDLYRFGLEMGEQQDMVMPDDNSVFYDVIERKMDKLKQQGLQDDRISEILNIDIEEHFQSYIGTLSQRYQVTELIKIVGDEIYGLTQNVLALASTLLKRSFDERIFFGLALHLQGSIERIRKGVRIYHPKLNYIRVTYEEEFVVAMKLAKIIDETVTIETPIDEIGYLTMFLATERLDEIQEEEKVGILVVMHGHATASSMAAVANTLLATEHVKALDMPLSISAEHMYALVKKEVQHLNRGKGILLLVDMGSLTNFGDMITDETGIVIYTLDKVSTPFVLEACRKALLGREALDIYKSLKHDYKEMEVTQPKIALKRMIITACFTGEGASKTLRDIVKKRLGDQSTIEVRTLNVINKKDFSDALQLYAQNNRILCVISTVPLDMPGYELIPAIDFMSGRADQLFDEIVASEDLMDRIVQTVAQHIDGVDAIDMVSRILFVVESIERGLQFTVGQEVRVGILLHMAFMLNRLLKGEDQVPFENLKHFLKKHPHDMLTVQEALTTLEKHYDCYIGDHEQATICRMFIENRLEVKL
jgi:transcriptional regulator with AAA-type ATPase domain/transcriptional regulatory protein LevR